MLVTGLVAAGDAGLGCGVVVVAFFEAETAPEAGTVADGELFACGVTVEPGAFVRGAGVAAVEAVVPANGAFPGTEVEFRGLGCWVVAEAAGALG